MSQARPKNPSRSHPAGGTNPPRSKTAITLRLDTETAHRLQATAQAENRTLTNYVETILLRHLCQRNEADRVITMYVAPGLDTHINPDDVIRGEGESDEAYAKRQALAVELWSIPDNA